MKQKDENGSFLTKEEVEFVEQKVLRAPDEDLTYAQVFPITQIPNPNAESHQYFIAEDDEGEAELVTKLESAPGLAVSNNRVTYPIYKTKLKAGLDKQDIETSRAYNTPLNVETIERIKRAVDVKINALAYVGDQKFGVPGIYSGSGYTAVTGNDLGTGTVDVANEIISYMNALPRKYRKMPYSLVLADTEFKILMQYFNGTGNVGDRSHMERVKSAYPNLDIVNESTIDAGTTIYDGSTVALGVAFLIPKTANICQMTVARAAYMLEQNHDIDEMVEFAVAARVGVVETPFPTAIGKITGLQG